MTTKNAVNTGLSGETGTGSFVGDTSPTLTTPALTTPTLTTPKVITSVNDTNANELIKVTATGSAVNEITIANAATAGTPTISATGDDTDISLTLKGKGTGGVPILGTSTNDSAAAGYVGEVMASDVVQGSAVALTTATPTNVTSITLTAGDWDIWGNVCIDASGANLTECRGGHHNTSATLPATEYQSGINTNVTGLNFWRGATPYQRVTTTGATWYLVAQATFAVGTAGAYGSINARRVR